MSKPQIPSKIYFLIRSGRSTSGFSEKEDKTWCHSAGYGIVNLHIINKKHKMAIWRDTDNIFLKEVTALCPVYQWESIKWWYCLFKTVHMKVLQRSSRVWPACTPLFLFLWDCSNVPYLVIRILWLKLWCSNESSY